MRKPLALLFAGSLVLAACGGDDYGRQDALDDLQEGGLDEATATCVVDEMEAQDIDFAEANDSDTDSELFDTIVSITTDCLTAEG